MSWARAHWKAVVTAIVLFLVGIGIGASGGTTKTETVAGPTVTNTVTDIQTFKARPAPVRPPPPPPPPPPPSQASDKDFAVQDLQIKDDGLGDIGGIARVTNTSSNSLTATFTFTFFQGSRIVGTAQGVANEVAAGQTVTVDLVSTSPIFSGSFRYEFQVDVQY
jgi:hypothetical protein